MQTFDTWWHVYRNQTLHHISKPPSRHVVSMGVFRKFWCGTNCSAAARWIKSCLRNPKQEEAGQPESSVPPSFFLPPPCFFWLPAWGKQKFGKSWNKGCACVCVMFTCASLWTGYMLVLCVCKKHWVPVFLQRKEDVQKTHKSRVNSGW